MYSITFIGRKCLSWLRVSIRALEARKDLGNGAPESIFKTSELFGICRFSGINMLAARSSHAHSNNKTRLEC